MRQFIKKNKNKNKKQEVRGGTAKNRQKLNTT